MTTTQHSEAVTAIATIEEAALDCDKNVYMTTDEFLAAEKLLLQTLFRLIPYVGSVLSALTSLLWPGGPSDQSIWNAIKDQVQQLINEAIAQHVWEEAITKLKAAQNATFEYQDALHSGLVPPDTMKSKYMSVCVVYDMLMTNLSPDRYEFMLLPQYCQAASLYLSLLSDGANHGIEKLGMTQGERTYERQKISRLVDTFQKYVAQIYTQEMAKRSALIPAAGSDRHTPGIFSNWQKVRIDYRKSCLDLALIWSNFKFYTIINPSESDPVAAIISSDAISRFEIPITPHYPIMTTAQGTLESGQSFGDATPSYDAFFPGGKLAIIARVHTEGDGDRLKRYTCENRAFDIDRPGSAEGCRKWEYGTKVDQIAGNFEPYGFTEFVPRNNPIVSVSVRAGDVTMSLQYKLKDGTLFTMNHQAEIPTSNPGNWGFGGDTALIWIYGTNSGYYRCVGTSVGVTIPLSAYTNILEGKCIKPNRENATFIGLTSGGGHSSAAQVSETESFAHAGSTTTYHYRCKVQYGSISQSHVFTPNTDQHCAEHQSSVLQDVDYSLSYNNGRQFDTSGRRTKLAHRQADKYLTAEMIGAQQLQYPPLFCMEAGVSNNDEWIILEVKDDSYRLITKLTHTALTLNSSTAENVQCSLEDIEDDDPRQLWRLESDGHGAFDILSADGRWRFELDSSSGSALLQRTGQPPETSHPWVFFPQDNYHKELLEKRNLTAHRALAAIRQIA